MATDQVRVCSVEWESVFFCAYDLRIECFGDPSSRLNRMPVGAPHAEARAIAPSAKPCADMR